jgi:hypothetical protein
MQRAGLAPLIKRVAECNVPGDSGDVGKYESPATLRSGTLFIKGASATVLRLRTSLMFLQHARAPQVGPSACPESLRGLELQPWFGDWCGCNRRTACRRIAHRRFAGREGNRFRMGGVKRKVAPKQIDFDIHGVRLDGCL